MIQINHSVMDEYLGAVNGMGQSFAALARAIGPALGGALWSIGTIHPFIFLNFIMIGVIYAICLIIDYYLPLSLDHGKQ